MAAANSTSRWPRRYPGGEPTGDSTVPGRCPTAISLCWATRAARAGVMLRQVDALAKLSAIVAKAVWQHATDHDYLTELTTWSGRHESVAGVPARNTPSPDPTAMIPGRLFAGPALAQPPDATAAEDHAVVLALGTADDDQLEPACAPAKPPAWCCSPPPRWACRAVRSPNRWRSPKRETKSAQTVFGDTGFPQMLLRVGWAPINADPLPSTPRRPLSDIVTWGSGSPAD